MKKNNIGTIVLIIFASLFQFPAISHAVYEEVEKTDSAIIYWSPGGAMLPSAYYKLYCRPYQSADTSWKLLGTTTDTTFVVKKEITGTGPFVLAVTACEYSDESDKLTSLDSNAIPPCGWYLLWVGSTLVVKKVVPGTIPIKPVITTYLLNGRKISSERHYSAGRLVKRVNGFVKNEIVITK
jgi:hypothetical protein